METKKGSLKDYGQLFMNKDFLVVLLLAVLSGFSQKMCQSCLTSHGMSIAGMTGTILGLAVTVNKIVAMAGRPVSGSTFDIMGVKKTLILAFLAKTACYVLLSFTNSIPLWVIGKGVEGFCSAIQGGLIAAAAVSIVGKSGRGMAICLMSAVPNLVTGFAPRVAKMIFNASSYSNALRIGGLSFLLSAAFCLLLNEQAIQIRKNASKKAAADAMEAKNLPWYKKLFRGILPVVLPVCTMGLFANVARDLNKDYIVQLGEVTGIDVTGGIAIAGVLSFVLAITIGFIIDRAGTTFVLYAGYGLLAASNLLYGFGTNQGMYTIAALCYAVGIAAYWPSLQAMVFRVAGDGRQGAASATLYLFLDLVAIVFGTITGVLYDLVGLQNVFKVMGFVVLFSIVYFTVLKFAWMDKFIARQDAMAAQTRE